jgi:hypothetical protein
VAEVAVHRVGENQTRWGAFLQALPAPSLRVKGQDLAGEYRTIDFGGTPLLVMRLLMEFAPLPGRRLLVPSLGAGYTTYVHPATGCTQGTESPLCDAAASVHGAHGPSGHLSLMLIPTPRSRLAARVRYVVTSVPDAVQQDLMFGVVWRPAERGSQPFELTRSIPPRQEVP